MVLCGSCHGGPHCNAATKQPLHSAAWVIVHNTVGGNCKGSVARGACCVAWARQLGVHVPREVGCMCQRGQPKHPTKHQPAWVGHNNHHGAPSMWHDKPMRGTILGTKEATWHASHLLVQALENHKRSWGKPHTMLQSNSN